MRKRGIYVGTIVCLFGISATGFGTETLTLDQALKMAKEKNGTIRSAFLQYKTTQSRERQAIGAFLPTITPSYQYSDVRDEVFTGSGKGVISGTSNDSQILARWQILDSGERGWALSASRLDRESAKLGSLYTLRSTLSTVYSSYYKVLRAQDLLRVADTTVKRTDEVLNQTRAQVEQKQLAPKEILQAEADALNAQVSQFEANNSYVAALADLKALIGWDSSSGDLAVVNPNEATQPISPDKAQVIEQGLKTRPDLQADRLSHKALRYDVLKTDRAKLIDWSLDASYTRSFSEEREENRALTFLVSIPLFDGFYTKEANRQAKLSYEASQSRLTQSERTAKAEIETAYDQHKQNVARLKVAAAALAASQKNYAAAQESFKLGAGTILDVLTAEVSLRTAESNEIQARYDAIVSRVQLALASGETVAGE